MRVRLVVGFASAMVVVLVAASAFVFWRVQLALDHRLNEDLRTNSADLRATALRSPPAAALAALRDQARESQLLSASGTVLASGSSVSNVTPLITPDEARHARLTRLDTSRGNLFSPSGDHLRILAVPIRGHGGAAVAVTAVRLDQRDEALRELLAQLATASLVALVLASLVGYRFAHVALDPVERYRARAEQITQGAIGVRLDVPTGPRDEITRLGDTLNVMLGALERSAERQQQFIDDASHELRTPLSTLSAEIELALRKPRSTSEYETTLRRLATDTQNLLALAETLLTLGTFGSAIDNPRDLDPTPLLEAAARRVRVRLEEGESREVRVRASPSAGVRGDATLIERALGNLADNAVLHGLGTITLTSHHDSASAVTALIVHDEGEIDQDFLPHAAERFRRGEHARSGTGAGLGLSLVDAIAVAHGGQLRVCSAGIHQCVHSPDPRTARYICQHPRDGTSISVILHSASAIA